MKDDKKVTEVGPKVLLDADILKEINRHYSAKLGEDVIGRECFSDPKLESHICNILARGEGGTNCPKCGNVAGRPCEITCDVHHFCLAVYATRLGIGVTKRKKLISCIKHNLGKLSFQELYDLVMERHVERDGELEPQAAEDPPKDSAQMDLDIQVEEDPEVQSRRKDSEGFDLITIADAARLYGCSHVKMFGFVKKGRIRKVTISRSAYVRRVDVEALRKADTPEGTEG